MEDDAPPPPPHLVPTPVISLQGMVWQSLFELEPVEIQLNEVKRKVQGYIQPTLSLIKLMVNTLCGPHYGIKPWGMCGRVFPRSLTTWPVCFSAFLPVGMHDVQSTLRVCKTSDWRCLPRSPSSRRSSPNRSIHRHRDWRVNRSRNPSSCKYRPLYWALSQNIFGCGKHCRNGHTQSM